MLFLRPHVVVVVVVVVVVLTLLLLFLSLFLLLLSVSQGSEKFRAVSKFFEDANVCKSSVGLNMFAR